MVYAEYTITSTIQHLIEINNVLKIKNKSWTVSNLKLNMWRNPSTTLSNFLLCRQSISSNATVAFSLYDGIGNEKDV